MHAAPLPTVAMRDILLLLTFMIGLQGVPLEKNPDEEKKMQTDPSIAAQPVAVAPVDAQDHQSGGAASRQRKNGRYKLQQVASHK